MIYATIASSAMDCPDENELGEFARGGIEPDVRTRIEGHLDECETCSDVVSELARIFASAFADDQSLEPEPEPSIDEMETTLGDGESPEWPEDLPLPEGAKLGRYVVLRAIGAGAMGIVYAAYDPELDRKVALKLLRRARGESTAQSSDTRSSRNKRLQREAQALARLAHPHAIAVHDVGTWEDQVFIAMEFVEGGTLTEWLRPAEGHRPWREVLRVFRQAGEGLAAAHEAGLVHRDFKPDNVLLHGSGRAVVTDFGLARPLGRAADAERTFDGMELLSSSLGMSGSGSALRETLTQTGALVGTPAYMAPEQLDGRRCDAKSDQFAFCVALYEGLYGERPFKARSLTELISSIDAGRIGSPPRGREVPRWLRRAVLRGLRVEPSGRYSDMHGLLAALRPKTLGTWRSVAAMGVMSLAAGAGAVALSDASAPLPTYCDDVAAKLDGVWDDDARRRMHEAFTGSGLPFADDVSTRVGDHLDHYAATWIDEQTDACRSEVEGREPEAVVAVRMTCLAKRRGLLDAMGEALADADADAVMQSIDAVQSMPSPRDCADVGALGRSLPPIPEDEREAVESARALLHAANSLRALGKVEQAHHKATEAAEVSETVDYGPVRAEAQVDLAVSLHDSGQLEEAETAMHQALTTAVAHDHDRVVAEAAAALAHLEVTRMGQPRVVERWVRLGQAALESLGGRHPNLQANLAASLGNAQRRAGDLQSALATLHDVLTLREQQFGLDHYSLAEPLGGLGMAYARTGDHEQSVRHIERARTILEQTYGEQHPHYSVMLQNLGTTHFVHGYYAEALELYEESHRLFSKSLGDGHPSTAVLAYNVATTLAFMERYDQALEFASKAQEVEHEVHGPRSRVAATSWALVGEIHLRAGRLSKAAEALDRAIEIATEAAPDERDRHANYRSQLGLVRLRAGQIPQAQSLLAQTLGIQRELSGEPSVEVAETSGRLAMVHLAAGRVAEARTMIDASVRQYETTDHDPHQHAEAWFRRAQILEAQGEREPARAEAKRALAVYTERADQPSRTRAVETWLTEHAP